MSKLDTMVEFARYIKERRQWWLAPVMVVLFLLGFILVLTQGSALAPFIYTLF